MESVHEGITPSYMCIMSEHDLIGHAWYDNNKAGYIHPQVYRCDPVTGILREVDLDEDSEFANVVFKGSKLISEHTVNQSARDYWEVNTSMPEWLKHNKQSGAARKKYKAYTFQEWNEVLAEVPEEEEEEAEE
jgi:hypothetical protein